MNLFKSAVPEWVKNFPIELDRATLMNLSRSSKGKFEKPREMNHQLYDIAAHELDGLVHHIEKAGWLCVTAPMSDAPNLYVLTATKKDYTITEERYIADGVFFRRAASMYRCWYDGWFAQC